MALNSLFFLLYKSSRWRRARAWREFSLLSRRSWHTLTVTMTPAVKIIGICAWLGVIVVAAAPLARHGTTAGPAAPTPTSWPTDTGITANPSGHTLVMFAHPHCPCTRASLDELAKILARCRGRNITAYIVEVDQGDELDRSDFINAVTAIPGLALIRGRAESSRFGVMTSGHVLLYGQDQKLAFSGGITGSRGHRGDNDGEAAVVAIIDGSDAGSGTPVYGCALGHAATCERCSEHKP
jgi:hypothetical protein